MLSFLDRVLNRIGYVNKSDVKRTARKVFMRGMSAGDMDRLVSDWIVGDGDINAEMSGKIERIRNRARNLELDNDHVSKFFKEVEANVVGEKGVVLQMRYSKNPAKMLKTEKKLNRRIEEAWWEWGEKYCTADEKFDMPSLERLAIRTTARDGECIIKLVPGYKGNKYRFTLQPMDAELLCEDYNRDFQHEGQKRKIRFGIEFDEFNKPINYHFRKSIYSLQTEVIPAKYIIHYFIPMRFTQARGLPWITCAMKKLRMLSAAEFAEVVAYRIAASKMGIWEEGAEAQNTDLDSVADEETTDADGDKQLIEKMEPGKFGFAPKGYKYHEVNPTHPNGNIPEFNTMILQGVASGIGMSYHGLSGDLTKVNYSSARVGMLSERELWKIIQNHFVKFFVKRVFKEFLEVALFTELADVTYNEDYADYANFTPRRWNWVDPQKEVEANILAISNGLTTFSDVLGEQGKDFDETMEQLKKELDAIKELGLSFPVKSGTGKNPNGSKDSNGTGEEVEVDEEAGGGD